MDFIVTVLNPGSPAWTTKLGDTARRAFKRLREIPAPSLGNVILAGTLLGLIALSAVGAVLHAELRERERLYAEAMASHDILRGLQGALSLAQAVESGSRAYAADGNRDRLEAYWTAARQLPGQIGALNEFAYHDAGLRDLMTTLERLLQALLAEGRRVVEARRAEAGAAEDLSNGRAGMALMDEIRRVVERMSRHEAIHARAALGQSLERSIGRFGYLAALMAMTAAIVAVAAVLISRTWRRCTDAEADLRVALARLRATFDGTMDGMLTINRSGIIETMNASAQAMLKHSREGDERPHVRRFLATRRAAKDGPVVLLRDLVGKVGEVTEVWLRRADRTVFPADIALNEIDLGGRRMFVAAIRDVSERHRIDRMKGEFVATVSHELRTPLTSIAGSLGLVAGGAAGPLSEKAARLVSIAHANSVRLVRLVNDILDMEKMDSGGEAMQTRSVEVNQLVASVVESNREVAEESGVTLEMVEPEARLCVLGDVDDLTRAVTNLLSNAVKFSPAGGTVTVAVAEGPDSVIIRVHDQGPGIPEDFRDRLFQRFSQADSSDTRVKGGTGLGLSIVKGIVERHRGSVSVDCPPDGGSVFEVRLPLHEAQRPVPGGSSTDQPTRVLLCEDEDETAGALRTALEAAGFAVSVAATGDAALAELRTRTFAAVLVDLGLPDRHGFDLVHELRNDPATHHVPVLVVTKQHAGAPFAGEAAALDILDWIEKPVEPEQVVARLKRAMLGIAEALPLVLHVDDDADVRSIVAEALTGTARLLQASSVGEARGILAREPVDAIVLDLNLGGGAGLDLLPYAVNGQGRPIPVIVFSAEDAGADVVEKVAAALTKSRVSLDVLVGRVRDLVRRHQAAAKRLEREREE